MHNENILQKG